MSRIDDSLAHGYAHNILREVSDEAKLALSDIPKLLSNNSAEPVNERRADRMVKIVNARLGQNVLWHHYHKIAHPTLKSMRTGMAVWYVPLLASREGMQINRLILFMERRKDPLLINALGMTVTPHVLARLFQRDSLKSRTAVIATLRPLANQWSLMRLLAHLVGHRQWGLPVDDDALVIGDIYPRIGKANTPDAWEITAKTYIKPLSAKWKLYRDTLNNAVNKVLEVNPEYLDTSAFDMLGASDFKIESNTIASEFSKPEYSWLRERHGNID